jgi:diaminohydroxyphosphoribosylaminopyrimidine deaminase/5-amino-6-(5-phosphoribosylamino)uracil reductase
MYKCNNKIKIKEVIYSVIDIDKRVKGKTFKILKSKKIKVRKELLKKKDKINFIFHIFLIEKKNYLMLLVKLQFQKII